MAYEIVVNAALNDAELIARLNQIVGKKYSLPINPVIEGGVQMVAKHFGSVVTGGLQNAVTSFGKQMEGVVLKSGVAATANDINKAYKAKLDGARREYQLAEKQLALLQQGKPVKYGDDIKKRSALLNKELKSLRQQEQELFNAGKGHSQQAIGIREAIATKEQERQMYRTRAFQRQYWETRKQQAVEAGKVLGVEQKAMLLEDRLTAQRQKADLARVRAEQERIRQENYFQTRKKLQQRKDNALYKASQRGAAAATRALYDKQPDGSYVYGGTSEERRAAAEKARVESLNRQKEEIRRIRQAGVKDSAETQRLMEQSVKSANVQSRISKIEEQQSSQLSPLQKAVAVAKKAFYQAQLKFYNAQKAKVQEQVAKSRTQAFDDTSGVTTPQLKSHRLSQQIGRIVRTIKPQASEAQQSQRDSQVQASGKYRTMAAAVGAGGGGSPTLNIPLPANSAAGLAAKLNAASANAMGKIYGGQMIYNLGKNILTSMYQQTKELDDQIRIYNKLLPQWDSKEQKQFLNDLAKTGLQLGKTKSEMTEASMLLTRSGYGGTTESLQNQNKELTKYSVLLSNVADEEMSVGDAADSIVAVSKAWQVNDEDVGKFAAHYVDAVNEISNNMAVNKEVAA